MAETNLPAHIRSELQICQNLKEIAALIAVCRFLGYERAKELGYTTSKIATQLGISRQKVNQVLSKENRTTNNSSV